MRRKPRLAEADTGLMRNIMTQQPAMPSRHVCQVKYRKVGLQRGGGDICCHVVPMLPVGRAQQGVLCQRATPSIPNGSAVPAQGMSGTPCTGEVMEGRWFLPGHWSGYSASPGQIRQLWPWG